MNLGRFPYNPVQFDKNGNVFGTNDLANLVRSVQDGEITDVFVISHGWNNDMADAGRLYEGLFAELDQALTRNTVNGLGTRSFAILGVLWPSKKFADRDLIASGAASAGDPLDDSAIEEALDDLRQALAGGADTDPQTEARLQEARSLIRDLEDRRTARESFARILADLMPQDAQAETDVDGSDLFTSELRNDPHSVFDMMSAPPPLTMPTGDGGAASIDDQGSAAGLGDLFAGMKSGARNLLNLTTYYVMKERAGTVGRIGVAPILRNLRAARPGVRLHLIGHSFGARVVTSAALHGEEKIDSLTLIQAAFSHYGFARNYRNSGKDGFFRPVLQNGKVRGPILITHTRKDSAVGLAYPLASRLAGQRANALGDANDQFGGLGSNGAQFTPEASDATPLGDTGTAYSFTGGRIYNLKADPFIGGHSDIVKPQVAHAILSAVATT